MNPPTLTIATRFLSLLHVLFPTLMMLGIVIPSVPHAAPKPHFTIKPLPQWIVARELPTVAAAASDKGILYLLSDQQIKVTDSSHEHYFRSVKKVLNQAALEDVSQVKIDFEPSYQQLIIHHIWLERGGRRIDALVPSEIKTIQQETELDQQLYNGTLTAVSILKDLRNGDVVDCAYSIIGENPVLGGKVAEKFSLSREWPVKKLARRLVVPRDRALNVRVTNSEIQPLVTSRGDETEYSWELNDVPAVEPEDSIPTWFNPFPIVELTEFKTWDEVVRWDLSLFGLTRPLSPALRRQIEIWRTGNPSTEAKFLSVLRFVQDEVRYMGIELGPYSHQPNDPSTVFERRFGDCKDKSLLLSSSLNDLGIEAFPVLVNTRARNELANRAPSPFAFDHCIVKARIDGRDYWVDPTVAQQRGSLAQLASADYGFALAVKNGVTDLEKMPAASNAEASTQEQETFTIADYHSPVTLEVTTTYRNAEADSMRYNVARRQLAGIAKDFVDYYSAEFPLIEADGLPSVEDDPESNVLVVREKYRISDFWKDGTSRWLKASAFNSELQKPDVSKRSMPLAVNFPAYIIHNLEIRFPEDRAVETGSGSLDDEAVHFEYRFSKNGNAATLNYAYRSLKDNVAIDRIAKHLELMEQIRNSVWYEVKRDPPSNGTDELLAAIILGSVVVAVLAVVAVKSGRATRAWKRRTRFRRAARTREGDGPETAIVVDDEQGIRASLGRVRCSCGARPFEKGTPLHQEGFVFDGRRLLAVRLDCAQCNGVKDVYFRLATFE